MSLCSHSLFLTMLKARSLAALDIRIMTNALSPRGQTSTPTPSRSMQSHRSPVGVYSSVVPGMNDVRSSTRTSFPLLSHHLLHFVHGRHTGPSNTSTKSKGSTKASLEPLLFANIAWRALSWCRRTSVQPPDDIEKSVTHRPCAMPLSGYVAIQAKSLLQLLRHPISREYGKQRVQIIRRTLAIIQSESPTHGTSLTVSVLMLPAGGVKK